MKQNSYLRILFLSFLIFTFISAVFAEGSKDLYPSGASGKRASLMTRNRTAPRPFDLFPTLGTMKVYVKAGETLYVGSSAQGVSQTYGSPSVTYTGTINLRTPNGNTYTSGTGTTIGRITNRTQELAGPYYSASVRSTGYTPFTRVVSSQEEGIWEIDFIPPTNPDTVSVGAYDVDANAEWIQQKRAMVVAWDVSVGSASNPANLITGRVFCNTLNLNMVQESGAASGWYSTSYVLTSEGYVYKVKGNGQNSGGFNFFVNNKGIQDSNTGFANPDSITTKTWKGGEPSYRSISFNSPNAKEQTYIYDPRLPDNSINDITHKIFFNKPSIDLPTIANLRYNGQAPTQSTWLRNIAPMLPEISDLKLIGYESDTENLIGPDGAYLSFVSNTNGRYIISLIAPGYTTRIFSGDCAVGENRVYWNGYDGATPAIKIGSSTEITLEGRLTTGEIHFPMNDVENNPDGFIIELTDEYYNTYPETIDIIYWNDEGLTQVNSLPNPLINLDGLSSNSNGHKWGSFSDTRTFIVNSSYGNQKLIDTWTLIENISDPSFAPSLVKSLDLSVDNIVSDISSVTIGGTVVFTVSVSNLSNINYSDAENARFFFDAPNGFTITDHTFTTNTGTGSINNLGAYGSNTFSSNLNLTKGGSATFTITCITNSPLAWETNYPVTASVMRPADITDVDATSSILGPPTDPQLECDGGLSGTGCNNIKQNSILIRNQKPIGKEDIATVADDGVIFVNTDNGVIISSQRIEGKDTDADPSDVLRVTKVRKGSTLGTGDEVDAGITINGQYGILTLYNDGSFSYNAINTITPAVGEILEDVFNYTVSDGSTASNNSDYAILRIRITENNTVPNTPAILNGIPDPEPFIYQ